MSASVGGSQHWQMGTVAASLKALAAEGTLDAITERLAQQVDSANDLKAEQAAEGPLLRSFRAAEKSPLKASMHRVKKTRETEKPKALQGKEAIEKEANNFCGQRQTPGQDPRRLANLRGKLNAKLAKNEKMTADEILEMVEEEYGEDAEPALIFEALEFLFRTTTQPATKDADKDLSALNKEIQKAQSEYIKDKDNVRRIRAAENVRAQIKEAVDQGIGSPKEVRDMYDAALRCETPTEVYDKIIPPGTPTKQAVQRLQFFINASAADIKAKRTSIDPAELADKSSNMRRASAIIIDSHRYFGQRAVPQALKEEKITIGAHREKSPN